MKIAGGIACVAALLVASLAVGDGPKTSIVSQRDGAAMVLVPAGPFTVGSEDFKAEQPVHTVDLPAFYIDKYEVTNRLYAKFVAATLYNPVGDWKKFATSGLEDYPVQNLSLSDCLAYAGWAGKRLPTEAEWEKAARGTKALRYPWGAEFKPKSCNSADEKLDLTTQVGAYEADMSPYGAFDMAGNVTEWTVSPYQPYPLNRAPDLSLIPESRRGKVMVRGGSYRADATGCRLTQRGTANPKDAIPWHGFRCVMDVPAASS